MSLSQANTIAAPHSVISDCIPFSCGSLIYLPSGKLPCHDPVGSEAKETCLTSSIKTQTIERIAYTSHTLLVSVGMPKSTGHCSPNLTGSFTSSCQSFLRFTPPLFNSVVFLNFIKRSRVGLQCTAWIELSLLFASALERYEQDAFYYNLLQLANFWLQYLSGASATVNQR